MDYTEDDTFKKLSRASFYEVYRIWKENKPTYTAKGPIGDTGWTWEEYIEEHYKRWYTNEL